LHTGQKDQDLKLKKCKSFDFTLFNSEYERIMNKKAPSYLFLTWLIGFIEGDGSLIIAKRGDLSFVITQDTRDIQVLNMIHKNLNLGKVVKQGKTTSRYIIQDKKGFYLIAILLNNNLVTYSKIISLNLFILALNKYNQKGILNYPIIKLNFNLLSLNANNLNIDFINKNKELFYNYAVKPTLQDGWFSGFTDSEGCFSVSISSISKRFNICFDIAQNHIENKYILDHFSFLFKVGKVSKHSNKKAYCYRVSGLNNLTKLFPYFDEYPLLSKKLKSYILWKDIHNKIKNKNHLNFTFRESLKVLASKVNNNWD